MENADRIYHELCHEQAGIWYISDEFGSKILVKLPVTTIKAIIKGCRLELLFGRDEHCSPPVLHTGLRVYDDLENPQLIMNAQRYQKDHFALAQIMHRDGIQIQFCNELNAIQAFGSLHLGERNCHDVLCFLGNPKKLFVGEFDENINQSLDRFQFSIDPQKGPLVSTPQMHLLYVAGTVNQLQNIDHTFYAGATPVHTNIEDPLEGTQFEKEILVVMQSVFGNDVYQGPLIPTQSGTRELIDLLAISEYGIFLIEAKALGIFESLAGRTMERKALGLQKQVHKAIRQLVGSLKRILSGVAISDSKGNEISFNRELFPHGIVLISEMLHFGDWSSTVQLMIDTMSDRKMFIHLMDLKEFLQFIGHSNGSKDIFDSLLMQRVENFVAHPSVHVRSEFYPKE